MLRKMYEYEQQDSSLMLRSVDADITPLLIAIFISGSAGGVHQCAVWAIVPHDGQTL